MHADLIRVRSMVAMVFVVVGASGLGAQPPAAAPARTDRYDADTTLNGYQLMVANDVTRGRFRKSLEKPEAIPVNRVEEYTLDLHTQSYRFLKGHRIMVQVQSSWFPLIDRNPQTFVPNIFAAPDSVFKPATQKIYRAAGKATFIDIPVVRSTPLLP